MSVQVKWLANQALLNLHEESIAQFGGSPGLRDIGLFELAMSRPQHLLAYEPTTSIFQLAAAYGFGLAKNHAFVDGNKRIAFLAIGVFSAINNWRFHGDPVDAVDTVLSLAAGQLSEQELAHWIQRNSQERD